ncbi:hypothetical protein [Chryseobacterium chendengshani]|uniref:hypothetical protein n=1 Tax=Chryseobacterium sp. LJ756 TaxID=2864113 RepID=UPI001C642D1D|nr:hypothetical protein [Chryseobacterium sp. LJ756]MBW7676060.1 hypothetical protein [Chryseobacterium sp. LJ756]
MKNTYQFLQEIDKSKLYSSDNDEAIIFELNNFADALKKYILNDFDKIIIEEMTMSKLKIEYDNVDYRQSATGIIYKLNFSKEKEFYIYIEILIDLERILICTKNFPVTDTIKALALKIESKYNHDSKTDLQEIIGR